jgi:hypothetical protein
MDLRFGGRSGRHGIVLVFALLGQCLGAGLLAAQAGDSAMAARAEIARLDSVWIIGAHTTPKSPDWFAVLDAGFRRTSAEGAFEDRSQLLRRLRAHPPDPSQTYQLQYVRVEIKGDVAESRGWFLILDTHGRVIAQSPFRNGYVRRGTSWLVLTSHWGQ